jgi:flagellar operon protein
MTPQVMEKLNKAVSGAASKGAKDSLILMPNMAFIVNIPNRTVVTAMDGESIRDNVFTNIDSTVIAG